MKSDVYLRNVQNAIKRQMKWAGVSNQEEKDEFLRYVITYCERLMSKPFKRPKTTKTRQESGRK